MDDENSLFRALRKQLWSPFECSDATVYHYTDQVGLLGILKERVLRAHSTRYLNDPTEGQVARLLWRSALSSAPEARELVMKFWHAMSFECFCASFSFESDRLSQWRGYAAGGAGFAIGFHPNGFHQERTTHYGRVVYQALEQGDLVGRTVSEHLSRLEDSPIGPLPEDPKKIAQWLPAAFMSMMTCFLVYESMMKDSAYAEEREYRRLFLVPGHQLRDTEIEFGTSARGLRPYVEMPFWNAERHFVKEIVVGPMLPFEETRRTLAMLLQREGYGPVEIRASQVPHRQ
jgi:hypothetical protein